MKTSTKVMTAIITNYKTNEVVKCDMPWSDQIETMLADFMTKVPKSDIKSFLQSIVAMNTQPEPNELYNAVFYAFAFAKQSKLFKSNSKLKVEFVSSDSVEMFESFSDSYTDVMKKRGHPMILS